MNGALSMMVLRDADVQGMHDPRSNVVECAGDVLHLLGRDKPRAAEDLDGAA